MIKKLLLCLAVVAASATPQGYRAPSDRFQGGATNRNQFSQGPFFKKDSHERFSGFDSKERFDAGFRQGPQPQLLGSEERHGGGFSGEIRGQFGGAPVRGFGVDPRLSGGFGGGFVENTIGAPVIAILRDERQDSGDGSYSFLFESEDGIRREESGTPTGPGGAVVQQGSWSFTLPDGTPAEFRFVADENGYQVDSNLLPTPHPLPPHALAQIEKAERERAAGIIHDGQYREEDHFGGGLPLSIGPGPAVDLRLAGVPRVQPQLISSGFKDSSLEDHAPFRGPDRFQSSFERDSFPNQIHHFGGGIQNNVGVPLVSGGRVQNNVGVPLVNGNTQGFGTRSSFQNSRRQYS